jgi:hypothetical protein
MVEVSAKAGVASDEMKVATKTIAAALAAWRGSAPMMFPRPVINRRCLEAPPSVCKCK